MKTYTFFTDSHKLFLDDFVKSFPFEDGLDLVLRYLPQECATGAYHGEGWEKTMRRKVGYIIDSVKETPPNEYFIHSDIDICFFGKIKDDLLTLCRKFKSDIMFSDDGTCSCMGFFIAKSTPEILSLFTNVLNNLSNFADDQFAANHYVNFLKITNHTLPERYYSYGLKYKKCWDGKDKDFYIPENLSMFHANWTIGVENKTKLMKIVRDRKQKGV
jgi:hypothetical protein